MLFRAPILNRSYLASIFCFSLNPCLSPTLLHVKEMYCYSYVHFSAILIIEKVSEILEIFVNIL
jgi:hypothetical protein